jgi:hypothetical protein
LYLSVFGLATEPRGIHALGKADLAQGRVALRNADAEADTVTVPPLGLEQCLRRLAARCASIVASSTLGR